LRLGSAPKLDNRFRKAVTVNIVLSIASAAASYGTLIYIAKLFGGNIRSDAYFLLNSISATATALLGSILGTVFLPSYIQTLKLSEEKAARYAGCILSWQLIIVTATSIALHLWTDQAISILSK
jgi:hypothetical protein